MSGLLKMMAALGAVSLLFCTACERESETQLEQALERQDVAPAGRADEGGQLPPGHPPAEQQGEPQLPPGHPPVDQPADQQLPPDHPPVDRQLPPGHPPIDQSGEPKDKSS